MRCADVSEHNPAVAGQKHHGHTHLCALMAAMVSTLPPAAAVTLPSRCGLSALPTGAASSPVVGMVGPRTAGCPGQPPDPACDNRGMLLLSDGAVLLLMDTKEASDLQA
jgi:hypothetical protein